MNEFKFHCPQCHRRLKIDAQLCGRHIRCPACQQIIGVPASGDASMTEGGELRTKQDGDTFSVSRGAEPEQAQSNIYWRRKEPPTSSHEQNHSTDTPPP